MARITKDDQRIHFLAGFTQRFLGVPKHLNLERQTPWRVFSEVSKALKRGMDFHYGFAKADFEASVFTRYRNLVILLDHNVAVAVSVT